jgi:hypothetical protein
VSHMSHVSMARVIGHQKGHKRPFSIGLKKKSPDLVGGGVKKCFLGIRPTALQEGKNHAALPQYTLSEV